VDHADLELFLLCACDLAGRGEHRREKKSWTHHDELLPGLDSISSAAFSAIAITAALVFPETTCGIAEASTTRSPSMPLTRICVSSVASLPSPIFAVQLGW